MGVPDSIALAAVAQTEGLHAVLVGGNAVNLHAYSRTTFDLDLLVPEGESRSWVTFFQGHGYEVFHQTPNFMRLRFAADPTGALPIDLMLSDADTFQKIHSESTQVQVTPGASLAIPTVLHLIAMKLHALRSPVRVEHGVDLQDVKHLMKTARIDPAGNEFRRLAERYGNESIRARIEREFAEDAGQ
jgi:hypothetical protein